MKKSTVRIESLAFLVAAICSVVAVVPGAAFAATLTAAPSNFVSVFNSAQGGDTILLGAGSYGTFRGALKSGIVTIKPQTGASVTMSLNFTPASNITIDGLTTITSIYMDGSQTKNITVKNSTITGQTVFRTGSLANANILFDNNHHAAYTPCNGCGEGRIFLPENTNQPAGITIQNSQIGPGGYADGIQGGANGLQILNNVFTGLIQGPSTYHTDAIQLFGSKNTVIRGNYFTNNTIHIGIYDGGNNETITDNVFNGGTSQAIQFGGIQGGSFSHNTLKGNWYVSNGTKFKDPQTRNVTFQNNIFTGGSFINNNSGDQHGCASGCVFSHSLYDQSSKAVGTNNIIGTPTFVSGANPTTRAGFQLAPGSLGKGNASDGLDRGVRFTGTPPNPPLAPPTGLKVL